MSTGLRIIVEHYDVKSGVTIEATVIADEKLSKATTLKEFGYLHIEQIDIIKKLHDVRLNQQIVLNTMSTCPKSNNRTRKDGKVKSTLHPAVTEHAIMVQRTRCKCSWHSPMSIEGNFGSDVHPDLLQKQALQGSCQNYDKSNVSLNAESAYKRSINNHTQICVL